MRFKERVKDTIKRITARIRAIFTVREIQYVNAPLYAEDKPARCSIGEDYRESIISMRSAGIYFPKLYQLVLSFFSWLRSFAYSGRYVFCVTAIAFLFWMLGSQSGGILAMAVIAGCAMIATRDFSTALLPVLLLGFTVPRVTTGGDFLQSYVGIVAVIAVFVVFAVSYMLAGTGVRRGSQFYPSLAMAVAFLVAGLGTSGYNPRTIVELGSMPLSFLFYVLAFSSTKKVNKLYVSKIFMAIGLLLCVQTVWYYLTVSDISFAIQAKTLDLGWGRSNNIAAMLMLTIPMTLYGYAKSKSIKYILAVIAEYAGVLLTLSRGCILIAVVSLPVVYAFVFLTSKRKKQFAIITGLGAVVIAMAVLFVEEVADDLFIRLSSIGFSYDAGRFSLYTQAINDFIKSPVIGVGVVNPSDPSGSIFWYHSTPLQFLGNAGIIGISAYIFHLVMMIKMFSKNFFKQFNFCIILAVLLWGAYAYIDVNFFFPCQNFAFTALLVFYEKSNVGLEEKNVVGKSKKVAQLV